MGIFLMNVYLGKKQHVVMERKRASSMTGNYWTLILISQTMKICRSEEDQIG